MNRQQSRYDTQRLVFISGSKANRYQATLLDISKAGARLMSEAPLDQIGNWILLDFGEGDVAQAAVRWVCGSEIGISFEDLPAV